MTEPNSATEVVDVDDSGKQMTWTNIYLSFPLTRADRAKLDEYLRKEDSSLSMRLRAALASTLAEAGVELPTGSEHSHTQHH